MYQAEEEEGVSVIERVLRREKGEDDQLDTAESTEVVQGISCSKLLYKLKAVEQYLRELEGSGGEKETAPEIVDLGVEEVQEQEEGCDSRSVASSTTSTLRGPSRSKDSSGKDSAGGACGGALTENMKQIVGQLSEICGEVSGSIRERSDNEGDREDATTTTMVQELLEKVGD